MAIRIIFSAVFVRISKSLANLLKPPNQANARSTIQRFFKSAHWPLIPFAMSSFSPNTFSTNSREAPQYPWSAEKALELGYLRVVCSKTAHPSLVSDWFAAWTFTYKRLSKVSTLIWRLRPLIFFPHQYPALWKRIGFSHFENRRWHDWEKASCPVSRECGH